MKRFSDAELQRVKDRHPISSIIGPHVTWDRAKTQPGKGDFWACCPFHGEKSPSFHCEDPKQRYHCFGCGAAGDQIRFLQDFKGMSFAEAVEALGGDAEAEPLSAEEVARQAAETARRREQAEAEAERRRREEIARALKIWNLGGRVSGTEGAGYVRGRGLLPCPVSLPIRFVPHLKYWHQRKVPGQKKPELFVLFSGPALLLPATFADGSFAGVHMTWIDPARPGKKIQIEDPEAEPNADGTRPLVAPRKYRGSQRGATLKLWTPERFDRLVMGEGWETTASPLVAEFGMPVFERTAYWVAISLQNLGGKAVASVDHPELLNTAGRPLKVPGPVPDLSDPRAIAIPDCVREFLPLGDGDSDRFTVCQVLERAKARYQTPDRVVSPKLAPDGMDFNDLLQEGASA
ncbi:CHC2 zinc finger domain-containing protein [Roseibium suaedae]|uniref:CHC2 zinc finger n=1 Tax=Roseibium suaedae TaxID=735517 RepID=A0A1M7PMA4_9HYPH|nr:CHC2 zinc finger domain-containing protein [Roseibium suaedae]SHN18396.1 CHC2 zinc finger [Roseibium suaedae]